MLPMFDLMVLLMVFPLLGNKFLPPSGVVVDPSVAATRLPQHSKLIQLNITRGDEGYTYYVDRKKVEKSALLAVLEEKRKSWGRGGAPVVRFFAHEDVPTGDRDRLIAELIARGFHCQIAYQRAN